MKTAPGQAKVCYPRTPSLATERLARSRVQASQMRCDRFPRNYPAKKRRIACHIRSISSWIDPASLPMFGLIVQKKKKSKIFLQQKNRRASSCSNRAEDPAMVSAGLLLSKGKSGLKQASSRAGFSLSPPAT